MKSSIAPSQDNTPGFTQVFTIFVNEINIEKTNAVRNEETGENRDQTRRHLSASISDTDLRFHLTVGDLFTLPIIARRGGAGKRSLAYDGLDLSICITTGAICRATDAISIATGVISRTTDVTNRASGSISRAADVTSRATDITSRATDIISRATDEVGLWVDFSGLRLLIVKIAI